jgi:hypothetical protein
MVMFTGGTAILFSSGQADGCLPDSALLRGFPFCHTSSWSGKQRAAATSIAWVIIPQDSD